MITMLLALVMSVPDSIADIHVEIAKCNHMIYVIDGYITYVEKVDCYLVQMGYPSMVAKIKLSSLYKAMVQLFEYRYRLRWLLLIVEELND